MIVIENNITKNDIELRQLKASVAMAGSR